MFRIKLCGLTRLDDLRAAIEAGADAIGLNFYPQSPRCLALDQARELARECPPGVTRVGVFVNASADEMRRVAAAAPLDMVQLHGDEPASIVGELGGLPILRAIRPRAGEWHAWGDHLAACRAAGTLAGVLIDAPATTGYGGTGHVANWSEIVEQRSILGGLPLVLAGGLRPENIAEAIRAVRPDAVDTASGVESSPGIKDAARMREFVRRARQELDS